MSVTKADVEAALARVTLPDGKSLMAHDLVRALTVEGDKVRFVIEAPSAEVAQQMGPLRDAAEKVVADLRKRDTAPQRLVITRQSIEGVVIRDLLDRANTLGLAVGRMPKMASLEGADEPSETVRSVSVEDLLGRPQKVLDRKGV